MRRINERVYFLLLFLKTIANIVGSKKKYCGIPLIFLEKSTGLPLKNGSITFTITITAPMSPKPTTITPNSALVAFFDFDSPLVQTVLTISPIRKSTETMSNQLVASGANPVYSCKKSPIL